MANLSTYKITGETPVSEFPERYNQLINSLQTEIDELRGIINEQNATISELGKNFNSALNALRADYIKKIADLEDKIAAEYVKIEDNQ